jgi:ribose 1,5-bisphosphokinase
MTTARLYYIVGASGAGKDTLIRYARRSLAAENGIVFAHRYLTRPVQPGGENHVALTVEEFALRARHGLFAMHWEAHGCRYGVGIEIDQWLAAGCRVVVNGSRGYLADMHEHYPTAQVIWITAGRHTIESRLALRGRESAAEIAERLERNARLPLEPDGGALRVVNDGPLEEAGARLLDFLTGREPLL